MGPRLQAGVFALAWSGFGALRARAVARGALDLVVPLRASHDHLADAYHANPSPARVFRVRASLVPGPRLPAPKSVCAVAAAAVVAAAVAVVAAVAVAVVAAAVVAADVVADVVAVVAAFAISPVTSMVDQEGLDVLALLHRRMAVAGRTYGATSAEVALSVPEARRGSGYELWQRSTSSNYRL